MKSRNSPAPLALMLLSLCLSACSLQPDFVRGPALAPEQLLAGEAFGAGPADAPAEVDLIAVNEDMRAFLQTYVPSGISDRRKVELILHAILANGLNLTYDNFRTLTAQETFYAREGNCLSFTNLFVALAREAGVDVAYQAVEVPPVWSERGGSWLFNLHINVLVTLPGRTQVVDFSLEQYPTDISSKRLSDREVLARYHNNLGVHWMTEGDARLAFLQFRRALELTPRQGFIWTNLGTLYRHHGDTLAAESAFLHAVELSDEQSANSNLARLYAQTGETQLAAYYRERVAVFRSKNPYYLYQQAQSAYDRGQYDEAESLLSNAISRQDAEYAFHHLLGLVYTQQHNWDGAKRSFRRAAELDDGASSAQHMRKLELLAGRD